MAKQALAAMSVPSASIAIVKDGRLAYLQAYGEARQDPPVPATPAMRYNIGSVSKQFAAAAILMLAEKGKLSLDDPVGRFIPGLTRGGEVTIREVLTHTSGYQDYWPQDYVPSFMLAPVTPAQILDRWARKPLDFDPGTQWQYSNTGYTIAGLILEHASGQPLFDFLQQHVFTPLGMQSVIDVNHGALGKADAIGYLRYGLGPLHAAPRMGKGWLFGACELGMTASDLATWDISIIDQKLMKPASYQKMESEVILKNGLATRYGCGVEVSRFLSHRLISHTGEVSGFISANLVFPDDRAAIVVLTNDDAADAASPIAQGIAALLFPQPDTTGAEQQALLIFNGLQQGNINRALFSDNGNGYFSDQALKDLAEGLQPVGSPQSIKQTWTEERGGMTYRQFSVRCALENLVITERTLPDGKIEQFLVEPTE